MFPTLPVLLPSLPQGTGAERAAPCSSVPSWIQPRPGSSAGSLLPPNGLHEVAPRQRLRIPNASSRGSQREIPWAAGAAHQLRICPAAGLILLGAGRGGQGQVQASGASHRIEQGEEFLGEGQGLGPLLTAPGWLDWTGRGVPFGPGGTLPGLSLGLLMLLRVLQPFRQLHSLAIRQALSGI